MRSTFRDSTEYWRDNSLFSAYTSTVVIYPCMVPLFWFKKKTAITGQASARVWQRNVHMQQHTLVQVKSSRARESRRLNREFPPQAAPPFRISLCTDISLVPRPCAFVACSTKFAQRAAWARSSRDVCHSRLD